MEERGAALDALSLWSIWSRSRINESGVKGHASRERGVRIKLSEEQHCIHLHPQEVVSVMLRRIVVAQTMLPQPEIPWHEQVRIEETVRCHQRCLVAHCQMVVLDGSVVIFRHALMYTKRPLQNCASIAFPANRRNDSSATCRDELLWTALAYGGTDVLNPLPSQLSLAARNKRWRT